MARSDQADMRVRFGECVFDAEARELTRGGSAVQLSPKAFLLLSFLLEHRPRAVSRTELHDLIWPRVFVSYTSLPRLVTEVRRALADRSRPPRFVRICGTICMVNTKGAQKYGCGYCCIIASFACCSASPLETPARRY